MKPIEIRVRSLLIPMKVRFAHATAAREISESIWVEATRGTHQGIGEGCPRSYVTGESLDSAVAWANSVLPRVHAEISDLASLKSFVSANREEIDRNPSAWCALELALLDLFAREANVSVEKLLGISEKREKFQYSAVLGADDPKELGSKLGKYLRFGFTDFKMKVMGTEATDLTSLRVLQRRTQPATLLRSPLRLASSLISSSSPLGFKLRLDANNAWANRSDDLNQFLEKTPIKPWAIEEPFAAFDFKAMSIASTRFGVGIILDESLCKLKDVEDASKLPGRWIANLRVSKLGGLLRTLEIAQAAMDRNWEIIIGAHVGETSVLSRAALVVARATERKLMAQEGAFGTRLLERDTVEPVLMFGLGGVLINRARDQKGLGLTNVADQITATA